MEPGAGGQSKGSQFNIALPQLVRFSAVLFLDPAKGDYRRRPGGPMLDAGADVPPPPAG